MKPIFCFYLTCQECHQVLNIVSKNPTNNTYQYRCPRCDLEYHTGRLYPVFRYTLDEERVEEFDQVLNVYRYNNQSRYFQCLAGHSHHPQCKSRKLK